MKRGIQFVLLFITLFSLSNCKKADKHKILYNKKYINEIKAARKKIGFYLTSSFTPGASVTVIKDGEIIYSEAFGFASKDLEVKTTRDTKFRIGSMSEIFTNVIYHKLVEQGTINPDSSIQTYYPEFPTKEFTLNVTNLAQQTSGIRSANEDEKNYSRHNNSLEDGINSFKDDALSNPPNVYQDETIFNYNLLGVVMQKATGKSYNDLLKEYVTDTLKLSNTVIDNPTITIKNRSNFFDQNFIAQVVNAPYYNLRKNAPSNGLLSTSDDLARLGMILLQSDYLSEETRASYFKPVSLYEDIPSDMKNGWILMTDRKGETFYGKEGLVKGGGSAMLLYPERNLVIAYAGNITLVRSQSPIFDIAKYFLEENNKKAN